MPVIKAKATFRNEHKLPDGVIRRGETVEVSASYADDLVKKNLAEIVEEPEDDPEPPEQDPAEDPDEPEEEPDPEEGSEPNDEATPRFAGVDFASEAALDLAVEGDLWEEDFEGVEASGKTGYTTADVKALTE